MAWPVLLGCVWLWAGPALAEVGTFDNCRGYFYKQVSPNGFGTSNTSEICQKYKNLYRFATLYDTNHRIPLWSAYTLNSTKCKKQPKKPSQWFVEPQLSDQNKSPDMTTEAASRLSKDELRSRQAVNEDYEDTSYDRGHLNPNAFQCDEGRAATFTLTNAAPMDPCFNRIHWYQLEKTLKAQLIEKCGREEQTGYLVTGTVPDGNVRIPMQKEDEEVDQNQRFYRVSVPSHIWTAVCCNHVDGTQRFSFAILAENSEESKLQIMTVEELNTELYCHYGASEPMRIFEDDCGSQSQKGKEVISAIGSALSDTFLISLSSSYNQHVLRTKRSRLGLQSTPLMVRDTVDVNTFRSFMDISSSKGWQWVFEYIYDENQLACVLAPAAQDSGISDPVCTLQEQKHLPGSRITARGWSCVGAPCGKHGYAYSWCYTSHSNDWDYCCTDKCTVNEGSKQYKCSRGDGSTTPCSPQYSAVTASGKPCRADHPCGLYENNFYWCFTDHRNNWEGCSAPCPRCAALAPPYHSRDELRAIFSS